MELFQLHFNPLESFVFLYEYLFQALYSGKSFGGYHYNDIFLLVINRHALQFLRYGIILSTITFVAVLLKIVTHFRRNVSFRAISNLVLVFALTEPLRNTLGSFPSSIDGITPAKLGVSSQETRKILLSSILCVQLL